MAGSADVASGFILSGRTIQGAFVFAYLLVVAAVAFGAVGQSRVKALAAPSDAKLAAVVDVVGVVAIGAVGDASAGCIVVVVVRTAAVLFAVGGVGIAGHALTRAQLALEAEGGGDELAIRTCSVALGLSHYFVVVGSAIIIAGVAFSLQSSEASCASSCTG